MTGIFKLKDIGIPIKGMNFFSKLETKKLFKCVYKYIIMGRGEGVCVYKHGPHSSSLGRVCRQPSFPSERLRVS